MRKLIIPIVAAAVLMCLESCSKISQIELKSCSVASVSPSGLRSLNARLLLEIDNPALQLYLSDIEGSLYYKGEEYVQYSASPVEVKAKTSAVYPLDCKASLSPSVSLLDLMALAKNYDLGDFTTDISAKVKLKSGVAKNFKMKGIPIKELLKK